jgi:hypothetical protein
LPILPSASEPVPNHRSSDEAEVVMKSFERRVFLTRGSVAVAAAGVVAAVPSLATGLIAVEEESPAAESALADAGEAITMDQPLVAHVRDLATGEIGLFSGTQEIVFHDPALAARLFRATR